MKYPGMAVSLCYVFPKIKTNMISGEV